MKSIKKLFKKYKYQTFYDQKKYADAEKFCREVLKLEPENYVTWNNLGATLFNQGKIEEAKEKYRRSLELNPKSLRAAANLGYALFKQKKYEEAESFFRKAIELSDQYSDWDMDRFLLIKLTKTQSKLNKPADIIAFKDMSKSFTGKVDDIKLAFKKLVSWYNSSAKEVDRQRAEFQFNVAKRYYDSILTHPKNKPIFHKLNGELNELKEMVESLYNLPDQAPMLSEGNNDLKKEFYSYLVKQGVAARDVYRHSEALQNFRESAKLISVPSLTTLCLKSIIDYGFALKDLKHWEINKEIWAEKVEKETNFKFIARG